VATEEAKPAEKASPPEENELAKKTQPTDETKPEGEATTCATEELDIEPAPPIAEGTSVTAIEVPAATVAVVTSGTALVAAVAAPVEAQTESMADTNQTEAAQANEPKVDALPVAAVEKTPEPTTAGEPSADAPLSVMTELQSAVPEPEAEDDKIVVIVTDQDSASQEPQNPEVAVERTSDGAAEAAPSEAAPVTITERAGAAEVEDDAPTDAATGAGAPAPSPPAEDATPSTDIADADAVDAVMEQQDGAAPGAALLPEAVAASGGSTGADDETAVEPGTQASEPSAASTPTAPTATTVSAAVSTSAPADAEVLGEIAVALEGLNQAAVRDELSQAQKRLLDLDRFVNELEGALVQSKELE